MAQTLTKRHGEATTNRLLLLSLAALLAAPIGARAEGAQPPSPMGSPDRAWGLSVGTGAGGFFEFAEAFGGSGIGYDERRSGRLQLNVRVDRELGRRVSCGLGYTLSRWTLSYSSGTGPVGEVTDQAHTLLAAATVRWYRSANAEIYSRVGAGWAAIWRDGVVAGIDRDDFASGFAFQLSYLGAALGNERLRLFAELGAGFEGLLIGGATVRF